MDGDYFDKHVSALRFNHRVLDLAGDTLVPLLERVRFLIISYSNLEEFIQTKGSKVMTVANVQTELALIRTRQSQIREELTKTLAGEGLSTDFSGSLRDEEDYEDYRFPKFAIKMPHKLWHEPDLWDALKENDIFQHHPYDDFSHVTAFVRNAAADEDVKAISMTMYRVGNRSDIIDALVEAATAGKKVHVLVELKARMDEERNLTWASRMEFAGVKVSYGFASWKTHAKLCVVQRKEGKKTKLYAHVGTGNYNSTTAQTYADFSLFTGDEYIGKDILRLFRYLAKPGKVPSFQAISISPFYLRAECLDMIAQQTALGTSGRIALKINSFTDTTMADALYEAAAAGVQVRLIVRGACIVKPSENLQIKSLVHRFLEHSRLFAFGSLQGSDFRIFMSSSDWKTNALDKRVEHMVELEGHSCTTVAALFESQWEHRQYSWDLDKSGEYRRDTSIKAA